MDKPAFTPAYSPAHRNNIPTGQTPAQLADVSWQANERTSFESALNRIRDRSLQTNRPDAPVQPPVSEDTQGIDDNLGAEESAELRDEQLAADEQPFTGSQASLQAMARALGDDSSETLTLDMALGGTELSSGGLVASVAGDGIGVAANSAPASSAGSAFSAETVAQMMLRLERTAGAHNGQWHFGVLNDQSGVTALQLQRSVQGGWRVNVSFSENSVINEQEQADELKAALLKEGHEVDSVEITRLADPSALDD